MPPPYRILTEIGHAYHGEVGTEGERHGYLTGLEHRLETTLMLAKQFQARPAGPQVATGLPGLGAGRVRALIHFHEEQQDNTTKGDRLNAEVIRIRQWIFRQGATLTVEGKILWPKSVRTVEYDTDLAKRNLTRVEFRGGRLFMTNGQPLDTKLMVTAFSGPGYGIYVMSKEGHIHVSSHAVGFRHHSSMLAGENVAGAGELQVNNGVLVWLSNKSGHYRPDLNMLLEVLHELQSSRVPTTFRLQVFTADGQKHNYVNVDAFMLDNGFDNDTFERNQIWAAYRPYLNPGFFLKNQLALLSAGPQGRAGIYDMSTAPPRLVPDAEFESKMALGGMQPVYQLARGVGR